jgi:hypothetical protein
MIIGSIPRIFGRILLLGDRIAGLAVILTAIANLLEVLARVKQARSRSQAKNPVEPGEEDFGFDEWNE